MKGLFCKLCGQWYINDHWFVWQEKGYCSESCMLKSEIKGVE